MAEIAVGGARVAIDAAVLAAAVRIDRLVEGDVRALVARDDGAGRLDVHVGAERLQLAEALPAVVERDAPLALEAARVVRARAAAAPQVVSDEAAGICRGLGAQRLAGLRCLGAHARKPSAPMRTNKEQNMRPPDLSGGRAAASVALQPRPVCPAVARALVAPGQPCHAEA